MRIAAVIVAVMAGVAGMNLSQAAEPAAQPDQHVHTVFFALKDASVPARDKLVAACKQYLSGQEGAVYFAVATLAEGVKREVSVRDFDVSLHIVFESLAAQERYQKDPRHLRFVAENQANWKQVRVFDSTAQ